MKNKWNLFLGKRYSRMQYKFWAIMVAMNMFYFLPLTAWGQGHHDTLRLKQVVVTATQHATTRDEAPSVVGVIDGKQMEAASAVNLGEALRCGTGLRVENTCQNCGANEVRINGLGQAYSQILIDSRPVNSALAGIYLMEQLPTALIERIEVLRGGGSALYGSNAIAGVVNIITHEPRKNGASVGNITKMIGGKAWDIGNSFNASVVSDDRRAGIAVFGHNRNREGYDHNGDGYSEVGQLKARMVGFRGYLRTSDYTKLNLEYHNIHDFRRGGDRFDLPSPMAHISEGGEHDINCANLKWDWLPASGVRHASLFASLQHVDRESYYGEREEGEPIGTAYGYTQDLTLNYGSMYSRHFDTLWFMPAEFTVGVEHTVDGMRDYTMGSGEGQTRVVPKIDYFYASPDSGYTGDGTIVYWSTSNAGGVTISVDGYQITNEGSAGSYQLQAPIQGTGTHSITLTAHSVTDDATQTIYFTMYENSSAGGGSSQQDGQYQVIPNIDSFSASSYSGYPGDGTTIYWSTSNAGGVTITVDGYQISNEGASGSYSLQAPLQGTGTHSITLTAHSVTDDTSQTIYYTMNENSSNDDWQSGNSWNNNSSNNDSWNNPSPAEESWNDVVNNMTEEDWTNVFDSMTDDEINEFIDYLSQGE